METEGLNLKQQQFCKYYIENKGNATKAYRQAYWVKNNETAKVNGSKLLTNANILKRVQEIMHEEWLNDIFVDIELKKMIIQDKNPMAKLKAISEYNKIRMRYSEATYVLNNNQINFVPSVNLEEKSLQEIESLRQELLR